MPLQVCYAVTINKAQGQSLEKVALCLPKAVFTHGQSYVAVSRETSPGGLKFFINYGMGNLTFVHRTLCIRRYFIMYRLFEYFI